MSRLIALIWKELLIVIRDKKVRIALLLPPIIQLVIFAFAATLEVKNSSIAILNQDGGKESSALIEQFLGTKVFNAQITFLDSFKEITPFIEHQRGVAVLAIDSQFSRNLRQGKGATVQLILDGRKSNTAQIVAGYVQQMVNDFNRTTLQSGDTDYSNIELLSRVWFNPNLIYHWYNIPCLVCLLSMLTALTVTTQSVALERELGTFDQLLVSPLTPGEIVAGKMIPGIIVGLFEGVMMLIIGTTILGVPFTGSLPLYITALFIFVTAISGVGLFISSMCTTQQQAMLGTFLFMTPSVILSGFATPVENMPNWLHPFSALVPLKYMLIISKGIFLKAMPLKVVASYLWPMVTIAFVNIIAAALLFRKKLP